VRGWIAAFAAMTQEETAMTQEETAMTEEKRQGQGSREIRRPGYFFPMGSAL
tara:strand:+ start:12344 stop:12499 length:156 start_codon:yes stop_codon:yes gene_type:complete